MTCFLLTEKRKRRKEGGKEGKNGGRRERKKEGKKERRQKGNVNVFLGISNLCSRLPPLPPQKYKFGSRAGKKMFFVDRKEEKKKGKKEGGKEGKREEGKKEGRKERRQKKECEYVFRHFQFCVVDNPLPQKHKNLDQGPGKKQHVFH